MESFLSNQAAKHVRIIHLFGVSVSLNPGTRIGPYEISALIGAGGMGEVYRARDTRLDRSVALKILPESFASDADRVARFAREAKTLAALNHPNIATVHGFEEGQAIAMELVEGPTLADRIGEGPLPIDEALAIAKQIADALEAAHDQGIIHRDLKPANIKLRPDGTVKVLDFGLAKALSGEGSGSVARPLSYSPTITSPGGMTGMGVILGTAAYMAPEQARGKIVDKRADIWAFGCVLYEMLAGQQAFAGAEVTDVLARIIERDPDFAALPPTTPAAIQRLLRRCLVKDRKRRLADVADARLEIDDALSSPVSDVPVTRVPRTSVWRKAIGAGALIVVVAAAAAGYSAWALKPAAPRPITRFSIALGAGDTPLATVDLSPDGSRLAYTVNGRLYLRSFDQLEPTLVAGGDASPLASPRTPFFSPDSQWLGFWESGQLKKVSVSGGAPFALCALRPPPNGVTWLADNTLLIGHGPEGILRVSADGGTLARIIAVDKGQRAHRPQLLPDGRTVLFTLATTANWDEAQIVIQSLDDGTRKTLVTGGTDARYIPTGHLVYALRNTLLAVPFDASSDRVSGGPVPLIEGIMRQGAANPYAAFAVSPAATVVYLPEAGATAVQKTLVWVDRRGREEAIPLQPRQYVHPRLSPDGTRVAIEFQDEKQNTDIWVGDLANGGVTRVTTDLAADTEPVWTPDGQRLIFTSRQTGEIALFRQAANGTGTAEQLAGLNRQNRALPALSPDGKHVLLRDSDLGSSFVGILDLAVGNGGQTRVAGLRPLVKTPFEEYNAEVSPNGSWLAYQSNKSGTYEVYVQPFPEVEKGIWPVSTGGGSEPLWARDGSELFYRAPNGAMMRVAIAPGPTWKASAATQLFAGSFFASSADLRSGFSRTYDVSPDGQRFLMLKNADSPAQASVAPRIVIVQNWFEELTSKVPTK